jgi:hypothetical protein
MKNILNIIGDKRTFTKSEVDTIADQLNQSVKEGCWDVAVRRFSTKGCRLSLFKNNADINPKYTFKAQGSGVSSENKVKYKLLSYQSGGNVAPLIHY